MLRQVFYALVYAYAILTILVGGYAFLPTLLTNERLQSNDQDFSPRLFLLNTEHASIVKLAEMVPGNQARTARPRLPDTSQSATGTRAVQSHMTAVHAGETLMKWPPPRVVQTNAAAVHAGATLITWPPPTRKVVQANAAAVHAGETPIHLPPPPMVVQARTSAADGDAASIKPPSSADSAKQESLQAKSSSEILETSAAVAVETPALLKRKNASTRVANVTSDALMRPTKKKPVEKRDKPKQRKPNATRTAAETPVMAKMMPQKPKGNVNFTGTNFAQSPIDGTNGYDRVASTRTGKSNR